MLMGCYATKKMCVEAPVNPRKNIVSNYLCVETRGDETIHKNYGNEKL